MIKYWIKLLKIKSFVIVISELMAQENIAMYN